MNNLIMLILVALCAAIISVILTICILKAKYEKRLSNFQDSVLKKQRDEVQNIYQTMRAWRHDYHNHIQSIKAMIAMDKKEELSDYLDNLEKDLDSIDIAIRTGNVGLDAILSSKVSIARKNNIDVNCTAKVPSNLTITDVHLCAIVGNLMDNAIEACEKIDSLPEDIKNNSTFHFIGHLQTNKVKYVIKTFEYIHSVDSLKLAQCISKHAKSEGKVQKIFLQVNNANEEQKFGFSKNTLFEVFPQILKTDNIEVVGIMNIAPLGASEERLRQLFSHIRQIRDELNAKYNCEMHELSMGMSQDYKIAAQEGATYLRIGTKLFT